MNNNLDIHKQKSETAIPKSAPWSNQMGNNTVITLFLLYLFIFQKLQKNTAVSVILSKSQFHNVSLNVFLHYSSLLNSMKGILVGQWKELWINADLQWELFDLFFPVPDKLVYFYKILCNHLMITNYFLTFFFCTESRIWFWSKW